MYYQPADLYQRVQKAKESGASISDINASLQRNFGININQLKVPQEVLAAQEAARPKTLGEKIVKGVGNVAYGMVKPTVEYAKAETERLKGMTPIQRMGATMFGPGVQALQTTQGRRALANVGSFMVPFGKGAGVVGKALLPGAISGGLQAGAQEDATLGSVAGGALLGAGTAGILYGAGQVLQKGLGGKTLTKVGGAVEDSARARMIGMKPPEGLGGSGLFKKMNIQGITGNNTDDIVNQATSVLKQNSDELVNGIKSQGDKVVSVKSVIDDLTKSLNKTKSPTLRQPYQTVLNDLKESLGKGKTTIKLSDLYALKQGYGGKGHWTLGSTFDETTTGVFEEAYVKMNDILEKELTSGGFNNFRKNNAAVSTAINALRYADKAAVKVSNQPIGLYEIIAGTLGFAGGGAPGAMAMVAAEKLARSPAVQNLGGKVISATGNFLQNNIQPIMSSPLAQKIGTGITQVGALKAGQLAGTQPQTGVTEPASTATPPAVPTNQPPTTQGAIPTTPAYMFKSETGEALTEGKLSPQGQWVFSQAAGDWVPNPNFQQGTQGITKEKLAMLMLQNPKQAATIKAVADMLGLGATSGAGQAKIQNALANVDKMEELYAPGTDKSLSLGKTTVGIGGAVSRLGRVGQKAFDQEYVNRLNAYKNMTTIALGLINQARGAGVLNAGEFEQLMAAVPDENTSEQVAKWWFADIRDVLSRMSSAGVASSETTTY
jgi:hypothetical protein